MDRFTADFRQVANVNLNLLTLKPANISPPRPFNAFEKGSLEAALGLGKNLDSRLSLMADVVGVGQNPPNLSVLRPAAKPTGFALSKSSHLTVAVGIGGAGFALFGSLASAGVYGSTTREVGAYLTLGFGLFLPGVGLSGGLELAFVFGTPTDFSGPYLSAGIGVAAGPIAGIGGNLLFSPGPPLTLMGYSLNFTANTPSEIPVMIILEATDTKIKPLLRF